MSEYRKQSDRDCEPTKDSADQPKAPGDDCPKTTDWKPEVPEPKLKFCPPLPEYCKGKTNPDPSTNCIDDLINKQQKAIATAEKAKVFMGELDALNTKAKLAAQEYTADKYGKLLEQWQHQDRDICELIRKLVCAVENWKCAIECYICPLLNELHDAEVWLYGDGSAYTEAHNLYDQRYWLERELVQKNRTLQRIKSVMAAWEKPGQTIEKNLADNAKLIADCNKLIGTDPTKIIYDVFLRIVTMHLSIAPPAISEETTTCIEKKYTQFCDCDEGKPNVCCGPDVGEFSLRQRIIGPQPNLVDPNDYYPLICCLVQNHYAPAVNAVGLLEGELQTKNSEIKRRETQLADFAKPGAFDKIARAAIPSDVRDCNCEPEESDSSKLK